MQIIATLVHEPDLVMLDEPFSGFDPINGALLNQVIARLREKGTTIVLSSHNMPAVEEICSSIALINHGRLLLSGPLRDIKQRFRRHLFEVQSAGPVDFSAAIADGAILTAHEQSRTPGEPHTYLLQLPVENHSNRIAQEVCRQSTLVGFHEKLPSLSELFIRFANGEEAPVALPETPRFPFQKL